MNLTRRSFGAMSGAALAMGFAAFVSAGAVASFATTAAAQSFDINYPLKLSYSRVAIEFDDQSVSTHPSRHWGLLVNDADSYSGGGIDRFSVHDFDSDRTPFTILPGAPDNSFWLNSAGRLGLGTAMPLAQLHLVGGSTASFCIVWPGHDRGVAELDHPGSDGPPPARVRTRRITRLSHAG